MFKAIVQDWKKVRGTELRKEVEDCMMRLSSLGDVVNASAAQNMYESYQAVLQNYGPLENLSPKAKKIVTKQLLSHAKQSFDIDMGKGHGLFLLSAHIEAQILPGEDAEMVKLVTENMLFSAESEEE